MNKRELRGTLVAMWNENLKSRYEHRRSVPLPDSVMAAYTSLPSLYALWKDDYIQMGGEVDWEIIPASWAKGPMFN